MIKKFSDTQGVQILSKNSDTHVFHSVEEFLGYNSGRSLNSNGYTDTGAWDIKLAVE